MHRLLMILLKCRKHNIHLNLEAKEDGYVSEIVADEVGTAAMILGAGRATKESILI